MTPNKELKTYKYFNGLPQENNLFTIIGFQKTIKESEIVYNDFYKDIINKHNSKRYVSFCILFDHRTCRIERYLINYGIPYSIRNKEVTENNIISKRDLHINHISIPDPLADKYKNDEYGINKLRDGKLTSSFIFTFITQCIHSYYYFKEQSFQSIFDIRAINALRANSQYLLDRDILHNPYIFALDESKPHRINITDRFYNDYKYNLFKNLDSIELNPVTFKNLPPCFEVLRTMVNGRLFTNNRDLDRRIIDFNKTMQKRLKSI